jgi:hypothetical protein
LRALTIAAFGESVYLRGIAACLAADAGVTVVLIDPSEPDVQLRIMELAPDAIAFEADCAFLPVPVSMSLALPDVLLVVLDRKSDDVLVLSGKRSQPTTASDLAEVLISMIPSPALVE